MAGRTVLRRRARCPSLSPAVSGYTLGFGRLAPEPRSQRRQALGRSPLRCSAHGRPEASGLVYADGDEEAVEQTVIPEAGVGRPVGPFLDMDDFRKTRIAACRYVASREVRFLGSGGEGGRQRPETRQPTGWLLPGPVRPGRASAYVRGWGA